MCGQGMVHADCDNHPTGNIALYADWGVVLLGAVPENFSRPAQGSSLNVKDGDFLGRGGGDKTLKRCPDTEQIARFQ